MRGGSIPWLTERRRGPVDVDPVRVAPVGVAPAGDGATGDDPPLRPGP